MFSSTGTRSDSGIGRSKLHTLRPTPGSAAPERRRNRPPACAAPTAFSISSDVADRGRGRIGLLIGNRERVAVALEQRLRLHGVVHARQRFLQRRPARCARSLATACSRLARSGSGVAPS